MLTVLRPFKIQHVKLTAGFEDAPDSTQSFFLLVGGEVMEHERREHTVETPLGIWKVVSKPFVELDRDRSVCCFTSGARETVCANLRRTLPRS
jgi:hypothetical protein